MQNTMPFVFINIFDSPSPPVHQPLPLPTPIFRVRFFPQSTWLIYKLIRYTMMHSLMLSVPWPWNVIPQKLVDGFLILPPVGSLRLVSSHYNSSSRQKWKQHQVKIIALNCKGVLWQLVEGKGEKQCQVGLPLAASLLPKSKKISSLTRYFW